MASMIAKNNLAAKGADEGTSAKGVKTRNKKGKKKH
jgi:hypothetical protein